MPVSQRFGQNRLLLVFRVRRMLDLFAFFYAVLHVMAFLQFILGCLLGSLISA